MNPRAPDRRVLGASASAVLALGVWLGVTGLLLWSTLDQAQRESLRTLWSAWSQAASVLLVLMLLAFAGTAFWAFNALARHFLKPAARLAEAAAALAQTDTLRPLDARGSAENQALARVINRLVEQRADLQQTLDQRVRATAERIELEKGQLAALMAELTQSVVVCNLHGRVLLYNQRARLQFRALSPNPAVAGGGELLGLGRSIYGVLDRQLIAHALESVQRRLSRGAAHPSAQFVTTTAAGQLLRVQMAPVRQPAQPGVDSAAEAAELAGFVLMLDNITLEHRSDMARDQLLRMLTDGSRAALAGIRSALAQLDDPGLDAPGRVRLLQRVREEASALGQRVDDVEQTAATQLRPRWPLEDMFASDLLSAARQRIEAATGVAVSAEEADPGLWIRAESFSLLQAMVYLAARLADELLVRHLQLRLGAAPEQPDRARLDLIWPGGAMSTETAMAWELDPMLQGQGTNALSVRDVVQRHQGAFGFERDRARQQAFFRFLLPLAESPEPLGSTAFVRSDARPEFYDFDLFHTTAPDRAWNERKLTDLHFTVFDTETTGLEPGNGDEIIQIGATRIVNGRLLRQECFEQLVNPGRSLPVASTAIHGISPEMLQGQPGIGEVLPAFHRFAHDTVLVAHNAAFDMRFLQLKEHATGVVFDQPVLDTLLLSALVHPQQDSHHLEAIAERFHVRVIGRHTALGDALVTAEVFLKLIPLLADAGIHTLGQALEAAERTYYARLKY